ncbi:MAG: DUF1592 domain-containing protein [Armatimonadota bacterium]
MTCLTTIATSVLALSGGATSYSTQEPVTNLELSRDVTPLITRYCQPCHAGESPSAGIRISNGLTIDSLKTDRDLYRRVHRVVRERSMPPSGSPVPNAQRRTTAVDTLGRALDALDLAAKPSDPGRVAPRRLNQTEYNNTVQDLFAITISPADDFPVDSGGGGGFDNNADTLYLPPVLLERYLVAADQILDAAKPETWQLAKPGKSVNEVEAAQISLKAFASRAFRRPVRPAELAGLVSLYRRQRQGGASYTAALRVATKAVLVSPGFLFRIDEALPAKSGPQPLDAYTIASRMSYFVWSSMPDPPLMAAAANGSLLKQAVQTAHLRRMLQSPRANTFGALFGGQWLRSREVLQTAQPDPGKYPMFTKSLRQAMFDEVSMYISTVVRENLPVRRLVESDFTFVNDELARHYGLPGIVGRDMRRVTTDGKQRGGLLGMGALLTVTSYSQRTSPVLRGKWVMAEVLGAPPPPPPPVVNTLPADERPQQGLTLRQRLEAHRKKPECKGCHQRIDPMGFALENFDAVGRWRTQIGGVAVDAHGELASGETFEGIEGMRSVLLAREDDIARNVVERLMAYALGRGLEPEDLPSVSVIVRQCKPGGYRMQDLMTGVVQSLPFRYKRRATPVSAAASAAATK